MITLVGLLKTRKGRIHSRWFTAPSPPGSGYSEAIITINSHFLTSQTNPYQPFCPIQHAWKSRTKPTAEAHKNPTNTNRCNNMKSKEKSNEWIRERLVQGLHFPWRLGTGMNKHTNQLKWSKEPKDGWVLKALACYMSFKKLREEGNFWELVQREPS